MGCLGNVIWFLFGGLWQGLSWTISGILWCITIIGIPIGRQCFKFASLAFFPFGKEIQYGGGAMSGKYFMACHKRYSPCYISGSKWGFALLHNHRHTVWDAML